MEILNNYLGKDSYLEDLSVRFLISSGTKPAPIDIKFPKRMKALKNLSLINVFDTNFTESMHDMAC